MKHVFGTVPQPLETQSAKGTRVKGLGRLLLGRDAEERETEPGSILEVGAAGLTVGSCLVKCLAH